ncbi:MAG: pyruvate dehydrogenase (acetyl-transferring) E1 component subunit alpha [Pyrinomonadaceae bacterium]|nr:pyruvate dehydrogenase (acetyl-transferring) E1 component subunit alpha [Pyrinomonadaceae bacterium]
MPKTTTKKAPASKDKSVSSASSDPKNKKAASSSKPKTAKFDSKKAKAEFAERSKLQLESIKKLDKNLLREMLYQMVLGRVFEQKCAEVYRIGKIGGFCHLYIGQEAIAIGSMMALKEGDYVITSYRDHVQAMVAGITPEAVMAELYGKADGNVKGKGGSMHLFSKEKGFFGGHGIVGGQIGVGTGMAYAQKYKGTDNVTLCFFGEAAVNQGIFHESLNMAELWDLPIIYICENNKYGMGTSQKRAMSISSVAQKAEAYGMAGEFVDGMDVIAVRDATLRAIKLAREESRPTLLEIRAYRYMGHSMSDPGKYRSTDEIKKYQERDPILLFKESLKAAKIFTDKDFAEIENEAKEATQKAVDFAENSPFPDESELFTDVYA